MLIPILKRVLVAAIVLLSGFVLWHYLSTQERGEKNEQQGKIEKIILPTFDSVRIESDGSAVLAGRASPFVLVSLLEGENLLGSEHSSARGEWVMVLSKPLKLTKPFYLRLRAKHKDGSVHLSDDIITISALVNKRKPHVVRVVPGKPSSVLQSAGTSTKVGNMVIEMIDYDDAGAVFFSGRARAGAKVMLYYNNKFVGQTISGRDDKWLIRTKGLSDGVGSLRLDLVQVGGKNDGKIIARLELPFKLEKNLKQKKGQVIIQPGDNLWKIARNLYGKGVLYTIIYGQNQHNIKDPNLIYPGQVLDVPPPAK